MKKLITVLLALLMLISLAACEKDANQPAGGTTADGTGTTAPAQEEVFSFTYNGVELVPNADFDSSALPEADYVYKVPSCAIEGTDNVYNYGAFEITAFDDGTGEIIYSIYLLDPNTPTQEGLYISDDLKRVEALYGTDYTREDTQIMYQKGNTLLILIFDGDYVASIEYRMQT